MAKSIDRTAISEFTFGGRRVRAGETVTIADTRKLKEMVAAGVVCESDEDDSAVPKLNPAGALQTSPIDKATALVEAQKNADTAKTAAKTARAASDAIKAKADADVAAKTKAAGDAEAAEAKAADAQAALDALKKA